MIPSALLVDYVSLFNAGGKPILDLACGRGRNGYYLHQQGLPVHFIDKCAASLSALQTEQGIPAAQCQVLDLEAGNPVLTDNCYQAIIVFRYLHRPLMAQIKAAVEPGGIVIYETFTVENRQFGRPNRDAFLLQQNELKTLFADWQCLHYVEGIQRNPDRAIAQIVCRKPLF